MVKRGAETITRVRFVGLEVRRLGALKNPVPAVMNGVGTASVVFVGVGLPSSSVTRSAVNDTYHTCSLAVSMPEEALLASARISVSVSSRLLCN